MMPLKQSSDNNIKIINKLDNVGVNFSIDSSVPFGHKIALDNIKKGGFVIKYGEVIGRASKDIAKGEWVHSHNLVSHLNEKCTYSYNPNFHPIIKKDGTFKGFLRENGKVGIRNNIYIIPTVGCVNGLCKTLKEESQKFIYGSVDNIFALTHQFGCSQLGEDAENIKNLIVSIALNPNATYVLIVGLGCENNALKNIKEILDNKDIHNIYYYNAQEVENDVTYGLNLLKQMVDNAATLKREEVPLSKLCIGLKCGGSDGLSGITANPTVGKISDRIIAYGGSAILTEVPEMFGAEQILMNKCINKKVYEDYVKLINDFKEFYIKNNFPVYENPSPGNKSGGITTLEEKSLGCITKAGSSPVVDVLKYTQIATKAGLSLLEGPGNDLIAATALGASGCQIVLFTTGRGTPFSTFVPTLKIGTNNHISTFKNNWIDFNAYDMDDNALFELLIKTINGEYKTKSENYAEIAYFKKGVTL